MNIFETMGFVWQSSKSIIVSLQRNVNRTSVSLLVFFYEYLKNLNFAIKSEENVCINYSCTPLQWRSSSTNIHICIRPHLIVLAPSSRAFFNYIFFVRQTRNRTLIPCYRCDLGRRVTNHRKLISHSFISTIFK